MAYWKHKTGGGLQLIALEAIAPPIFAVEDCTDGWDCTPIHEPFLLCHYNKAQHKKEKNIPHKLPNTE